MLARPRKSSSRLDDIGLRRIGKLPAPDSGGLSKTTRIEKTASAY